MATNKPTRTPRTPKTVPAVPSATVPATTGTTTITTPAAPAVPAVRTLADVIPADVLGTFVAPTFVGPMVNAIRAIASMPTKTRDERAACVTAYTAVMIAETGITADPVGKHTGRFTGYAVFETQNAIYFACVLANVAVNDGHIVAAWRAELPMAKCDYLGTAYDRAYPTSTLSLYVNDGHNGGVIPGMRDAVRVWQKSGRKPVTT